MRRFGSKRSTGLSWWRNRVGSCSHDLTGRRHRDIYVVIWRPTEPRSCSTRTCWSGSTASPAASARRRPRSSRGDRGLPGRARHAGRAPVPGRRAEPHGRLSLDGRSIARREAGRRGRPLTWRSCSTRARSRGGRSRRPQPRRGGRLVRAGRRAAAAGRAQPRRARHAAPARLGRMRRSRSCSRSSPGRSGSSRRRRDLARAAELMSRRRSTARGSRMPCWSPPPSGWRPPDRHLRPAADRGLPAAARPRVRPRALGRSRATPQSRGPPDPSARFPRTERWTILTWVVRARFSPGGKLAAELVESGCLGVKWAAWGSRRWPEAPTRGNLARFSCDARQIFLRRWPDSPGAKNQARSVAASPSRSEAVVSRSTRADSRRPSNSPSARCSRITCSTPPRSITVGSDR